MSSAGSTQALINARRETLLNLPTFRRALLRDGGLRCVIPATGFYEWYKVSGGLRRSAEPFLIYRKIGAQVASKGMFMAGLYDIRRTDEGEEASFVIITTGASDEFQWLHDRQPCYLDSQREIDDWLDSSRVPANEAVSQLLETRLGIEWSRMTPDLSKRADNQRKPKAQTDISAFLARAEKPYGDGESKEASNRKERPHRRLPKLAVAQESRPDLKRQGKTGQTSKREKRRVQTNIGSFFRS